MTEYLYHTDSYLREFDAVVTSMDETARAVVLDRTAFYPGGGGQLCDLGTLTSGNITLAGGEDPQRSGWDRTHPGRELIRCRRSG